MTTVIIVGLKDKALPVGANEIEQVDFTAEVVGVFVSDDSCPRHVRANGCEFFFRKQRRVTWIREHCK